MIIIFARHGETKFGKQERIEGWSSSSLTSLGRKQAKILAKFCKQKKVTKIYASPLKRAQQTAFEVSKLCGLKVSTQKILKEVCYGSFDGKVKEELKRLKVWEEREKNLFKFIHPGFYKRHNGESYEMLLKRLKPFFNKLIREKEIAIIVISHLGVVRSAVKYFDKITNKEFNNLKVSNDNVYVISVNDNKQKTKFVKLG